MSSVVSAAQLTDVMVYRCQNFFLWEGWTGLLGFIFAAGTICTLLPKYFCSVNDPVILQTRIYALYRERRGVIRLMLISFIASSVTSGVIVGRGLKHIDGAIHPIVPNENRQGTDIDKKRPSDKICSRTQSLFQYSPCTTTLLCILDTPFFI